ncbi:MAG: ATP-dependent Clp protease adapter ClpS [Proteobacteria bacterium]|nr:MAG: ATP-dependent Clp protease adapter ClpS [Pseudomonadota bacterium]
MATKEQVKNKEKLKLDGPSRYKVVLLNDDYTTMDFVIEILMSIFALSSEEAVAIMMKIHEKGKGVCGIYPYEIAETKAIQVEQTARANGFPLRAILEEE